MLALRLFFVLLTLVTRSKAYKLTDNVAQFKHSPRLEIPEIEFIENQETTLTQNNFLPPTINYEQGFKLSSIFLVAHSQQENASKLRNINNLAQEISLEIEEFLAKLK